jgi:hypothetical protein
MSKLVTLTGADGSKVEFIDEIKASGGMKDIYFSPNKDYVVGFFRGDANNAATRERVAMITGTYRERIFNQAGGDYWKNANHLPSLSRPSTTPISSSNSARATTTCSVSAGATRKASGLRRRRTATSTSTRANWATGCARCACA